MPRRRVRSNFRVAGLVAVTALITATGDAAPSADGQVTPAAQVAVAAPRECPVT